MNRRSPRRKVREAMAEAGSSVLLERASHGRGLIEEADDGKLEKVIVALAIAPAFGDDEACVEVVTEEHRESGKPAHAVQVRGWSYAYWPMVSSS